MRRYTSSRSAGAVSSSLSAHSIRLAAVANEPGRSSLTVSATDPHRYRSKWCTAGPNDASWSSYTCCSRNVGEGTSMVGSRATARTNARLSTVFPAPTSPWRHTTSPTRASRARARAMRSVEASDVATNVAEPADAASSAEDEAARGERDDARAALTRAAQRATRRHAVRRAQRRAGHQHIARSEVGHHARDARRDELAAESRRARNLEVLDRGDR